MPTARELTQRPHSYRNFEPDEFLLAIDQGEDLGELRSALNRVESARFTPLLENLSSMFSRLDRDERVLFTQRNPGLVRWMSVYNRLQEFNPYEEFFEMAGKLLDQSGWQVPPFERDEVHVDVDGLIRDMLHRRRSYRNWTPGEFMEVGQGPDGQRRELSLGIGLVRELGVFTPEGMEDLREQGVGEVDMDSKLVMRGLFDRIEAGRFEPVLRAAHKFFAPLDPDERREFARRNPGIIMWISAWGYSEDQIWGEEQLFPISDVDWPFVREVGGRSIEESQTRPSDGIAVHGIDDREARETLREVINSRSVSGVQAPFRTTCPEVWDDETGLADFDRELKGGAQMVYAKVCLTPKTFLRLQMAVNLVRGFEPSVEEWLTEPLRSSSLPEMIRLLESGERDLPTPLIELDNEGELRGFQEGRSRGVAAYYAGIDQMPVYVFLNTRKRDGAEEPLNPPSEFEIVAHLDDEREGVFPEESQVRPSNGIEGVEEFTDALEEYGNDIRTTRVGNAEWAIDFDLDIAPNAPRKSSLTYNGIEDTLTGVALRLDATLLDRFPDERLQERLEGLIEGTNPPSGGLWHSYLRGDAAEWAGGGTPHIMTPGDFSAVDPDDFIEWLGRLTDRYQDVFDEAEPSQPEVRLTHDDPEYRQVVEDELDRLRDLGLLGGLELITDDPDIYQGSVDDRHSGRYNPETDSLYIAPEEVLGPSPGREGYFSTDANLGSIWHELAHHRIREENPSVSFEADVDEDYWMQTEWQRFAVEGIQGRDWRRFSDPANVRKALNEMFDEITAEVSEYATFGPMEFVAEVFAGRLAGERYPEWVDELYDRLLGPTTNTGRELSQKEPDDPADRITRQQREQEQEFFDVEGTVSQFRAEIREQMAKRVLENLAERGQMTVTRLSDPGDQHTKLDTPEGELTLPKFPDDITNDGERYIRQWDLSPYLVRYTIDRAGETPEHILQVTEEDMELSQTAPDEQIEVDITELTEGEIALMDCSTLRDRLLEAVEVGRDFPVDAHIAARLRNRWNRAVKRLSFAARDCMTEQDDREITNLADEVASRLGDREAFDWMEDLESAIRRAL